MNRETIRDTVDHPAHYTFGTIEVIDAIEDWQLDYHLGNVIKYVVRSNHKGKAVEDLRKAVWYLRRRIESMESDNNGCGKQACQTGNK